VFIISPRFHDVNTFPLTSFEKEPTSFEKEVGKKTLSKLVTIKNKRDLFLFSFVKEVGKKTLSKLVTVKNRRDLFLFSFEKEVGKPKAWRMSCIDFYVDSAMHPHRCAPCHSDLPFSSLSFRANGEESIKLIRNAEFGMRNY